MTWCIATTGSGLDSTMAVKKAFTVDKDSTMLYLAFDFFCAAPATGDDCNCYVYSEDETTVYHGGAANFVNVGVQGGRATLAIPMYSTNLVEGDVIMVRLQGNDASHVHQIGFNNIIVSTDPVV